MMAGATARWGKTLWQNKSSFSPSMVAQSCNSRSFLITTASTFRVSLTSSTSSVGARSSHTAAASGCSVAVPLACLNTESAGAAAALYDGAVSLPLGFFSQRFSSRRRGSPHTLSRFLSCCNSIRKTQRSVGSNAHIIISICQCNGSSSNSSCHTDSSSNQLSAACFGYRRRCCSSLSCVRSDPSRSRVLLRDRRRYESTYSHNYDVPRDVSDCGTGSSRCCCSSRLNKKTYSSSSSHLSNSGPWSSSRSSRCDMKVLRWRIDTHAMLSREGKSFPHFFFLSRSASFFSSAAVDTAASVSGALLRHSVSDSSSLLRRQQSRSWVAAAASSVRGCCSYPGYNSSSRDSNNNKERAAAAAVAAAAVASSQPNAEGILHARGGVVGGSSWGDSSSEDSGNTGWAKVAAALTAAAAAAAAVTEGGSDHRKTHEHYGNTVNIPRAWYSVFLSSELCPSFVSPPSSGFHSPAAAVSSPPSRVSRASLLHCMHNMSEEVSSCMSSSSSSSLSANTVVRGVVSMVGRSALARCCGIVGYVGDREAQPLLLRGLEILQNRGYDSCGITSVPQEGGELVTTKYASRGTTCDSLDILRKEGQEPHTGNRIGIGHTRWATHGSKTDINAHPHHDWKDRVSVVHNGTIDNFSELKQELVRRGCTFRSETDTEVIANLIGWHLDQGIGFEEAVKNAIGSIQGTWGLCVLHKDYPDRLVLARNGSPLLVGASSGQVFVASEPAALAQHTNQYLMLKDGEIAVVSADGVGQLEASRPIHFIGKDEKIEVSPSPFPHWTIKEIYEQPQALARAMNYGGRIAPYRSAVKLGGLDQSRESLLAIKNLLICGCGTSLYAALYGELLMQWLGCLHQVRAVDACELELHAFPKEDAGILLLSQSGETLDTIRACQLAEIHGIKKFSVVNQVGSLLARLTDCGVYVNAGREVAVASTKAFTCQVTALSLIAAWFFQNKSEHPASQQHSDRCSALMDAIQRLPVYAGMTLNCRDACASVARKIAGAKTIFILGKGFGYPVALEGALKMKEVGCIHAEGFAAGALKHGPFALIDEVEQTPVIMMLLGDQNAAYMLNAAQQVKARGAHLVCVTDVPEAVKGIADDIVVVPSNGPLTALLAAIPLQLLAYEVAVTKGINPDKPRGLAKTVTVF